MSDRHKGLPNNVFLLKYKKDDMEDIMLPPYKNDEYYKGFIGKCFRRRTNDKDTEYSVSKILDFSSETRMFFVEHCYLALGNGVIENHTKYYCFVDAENFYEISESDYLSIRFLCKN